MNAPVDLRQLAVRRNGSPPPPVRHRRHLLTRYVLPAGVLLGFVGVVGWAARDSLIPARPVTVVPVHATRAEVQQEGTPLFQAAGWIEPRPTPTLVSALAEGVVDKLLVVEGQEVRAGEVVAVLIDAEARLALREAEAQVRLRQAEAASTRANLVAARTNLDQPAHLRAAFAEADAQLAQKQTELTGLSFQLRGAQARFRLAGASLDGQKRAAGSLPELQLHQAQSEWDTAGAAVEELQARTARLEREVEAQTLRRDAHRQRLDLKTEETRQLADTAAQVDAAEARLRLAEVAADAARLRLDRMTVRAPTGGRVLALAARPGSRLMGLATGTHQDASTVVSLYDPARLQIRADVRLEDVPRVVPGQPVQVVTPAAPGGPLAGEVLFPTSQADIQKNTLQVKVALNNPPPTLRPDMLVQTTFLAPASAQAAGPASEKLRLLIPRQLVESGDGGAHVWVADQSAGVARRRTVQLGPAAGEWVEVVEGLNAADRLIASGRDGLRDGQRISVTGEEAPPPAASKPSRLPHHPG
jgi:RND family efflux transporter MFP subunit